MKSPTEIRLFCLFYLLAHFHFYYFLHRIVWSNVWKVMKQKKCFGGGPAVPIKVWSLTFTVFPSCSISKMSKNSLVWMPKCLVHFLKVYVWIETSKLIASLTSCCWIKACIHYELTGHWFWPENVLILKSDPWSLEVIQSSQPNYFSSKIRLSSDRQMIIRNWISNVIFVS